jgi:hypothetical protein
MSVTVSPSRMLLFRALGLAWLVTGHALYGPPAILPFGGAIPLPIDHLVAAVIATPAIVACLALCHPRTARFGGAVLFASIVGLTLVSEPYFANYRLFVAALLFVAVVAPPDADERALRLQAALVYAGAAIDKLTDPAFRDGSVVRALVRTVIARGAPYAPGHPHGSGPSYAEAVAGLSGTGFAVLAAVVIGLELAIVVGYVTRSKHAIALVASLHVGIALVTGSTFGVFLHAGIVAAVALAPVRSRRLDAATLVFVVYASSPLERPIGIALGALALVLLGLHEASHSKSGSS